MSGLICLNPFIACLGSAYTQTVPPDVLLVNPVIAQEASAELGGWLGRVVVRTYYTKLKRTRHQQPVDDVNKQNDDRRAHSHNKLHFP